MALTVVGSHSGWFYLAMNGDFFFGSKKSSQIFSSDSEPTFFNGSDE